MYLLNCHHFLRFYSIDQARQWLGGVCFVVRAHSLHKQVGSSAILGHSYVKMVPVI